MRFIMLAAIELGLVSVGTDALAQPPARVGTCERSVIVSVGTRFNNPLVKPKRDDIDAGASVQLKNGVYGVSYDYVAALGNSRIGDRVITCLTSLPKGCPKGDNRGRIYTTTNLRTQESWSLADSQHMCGGA